jgi:hypothetical protein
VPFPYPMLAAVPQWRNGRRGRLKICCSQERAGSSPAWGTTSSFASVRTCPLKPRIHLTNLVALAVHSSQRYAVACWYPTSLLVFQLAFLDSVLQDTNMLNDARVRHAKPSQRPVKLSDAGGLHLLIQPHGSKLWRMAYRFAGKQKTLALGSYPIVSLQEAREQRDAAKRLLARGIDPSVQRQLERQAAQAPGNTFKTVAEEFLAKLEREDRAVPTLTKKRWLLQFAYPSIGHRPISEITAPELLAILRRIEDRGCYETAQRLRSTFGTIFRYAIATSRAERDPAADLRGALTSPKVLTGLLLLTQRALARCFGLSRTTQVIL